MNTCDANGGESTGKIRLSSSSAQKCVSINCCKCHIDLLCASERTAWTNPDISRQALSSRVWWLRPIKRFDGENRLAASGGRRRSDRQTDRQRERMRETAAAECNCRALEPASRRRRERMTMHALMPIRLGPRAQTAVHWTTAAIDLVLMRQQSTRLSAARAPPLLFYVPDKQSNCGLPPNRSHFLHGRPNGDQIWYYLL